MNTILVVEDEQDIRMALQLYLESEGYQVQTASNGQEALEALTKQGLPNLILLDMKMPVMNGWEFAKVFNAHYDHQVPIVVMSAAVDAESRASEIQAEGWMGKPFELDDLKQKIQSLTQGH
ncbi:MAG: response regulator [Bdellovibrionia bacterium]